MPIGGSLPGQGEGPSVALCGVRIQAGPSPIEDRLEAGVPGSHQEASRVLACNAGPHPARSLPSLAGLSLAGAATFPPFILSSPTGLKAL